MKKVLVVMFAVLLVGVLASAEVNTSNLAADQVVAEPGTLTPGTLGSFAYDAYQTGSLQVYLEGSCTTQGGDGVARTFNTQYGGTVVLQDQVGVYLQIYDAPWDGGCSFWDPPGPDWCAAEWGLTTNSPNPMGSFSHSMTTSVPAPADYQTFFLFAAGATWTTTDVPFGYISSSVYYSVAHSFYVDSTQPPTPTPDPNAGGQPIPTLNWLGMLAMVAMLLGVAVLVIIRRR